ncbi:TPA: hypothetical protein ACUT60_002774 [Pseudomonas aeruginosa]
MTTPISDEQLAELEQAAIEIKGWNLVDAFRYADPCIEDAEDEEWYVGSIDEDGNQYPVMEVNAHQYDSQDSELLAHYYGLCNRESILGLIARLRAAENRLKFVIDEEITIRQMNGTGQPMVYQCQWHDCRQAEWHPSPIAAIDAAMERTP